MNQPFLKGLFYETTLADKSTVLYTLKDQDHVVGPVTYPSLYRLYMAENDPTEWSFAQKHLDGWRHWETLTECTWFNPYVLRWRKELDLRMKSGALARIMSEAKTGSKDSLTANKYLLERGWEPKDTKRGRPSKDEIKSAANEIATANTRLDEDFKRLQIKRN